MYHSLDQKSLLSEIFDRITVCAERCFIINWIKLQELCK